MIGKYLNRLVIAGIGTLLAGTFALTAQSEARDRYSDQPPVVLSPDLTEPWQLQLSSRKKARVVVRSSSSYARTPRQSKRRAQSLAYRTPAFNTGSSLRRQKQRPRHSTSQRSRQLPSKFLPQIVEYNTKHKPGTVIVDTHSRFLYLVLANGEAKRYGVGVGKEGFSWTGTERVTRKAEWPSWRPPAEMIAREAKKGRHLPTFMPGGVENPMGARGIYLGSTLYRIHGTNAPWTIGHAVSSGCIRMRNEDVSDLYQHVRLGAKVVVI